MHVISRFAGSPRLSPEALGLSPDDAAVAAVIAQEAESERARRRSGAPESATNSPGSLLGGEWDYYDTIAWDELIQSTEALDRCAAQTGLSRVQVLRFAAEKCHPRNLWALFWMAAYLEVLQVTTLDPIFFEQATRAVEESAAVARQKLAASGGAGRGAKFEPARDWVIEEWVREGAKWDTKKLFAETYQERIKIKFGVTVSWRQIADVWLQPPRPAGKTGT